MTVNDLWEVESTDSAHTLCFHLQWYCMLLAVAGLLCVGGCHESAKLFYMTLVGMERVRYCTERVMKKGNIEVQWRYRENFS